jgi:hypothetical protein
MASIEGAGDALGWLAAAAAVAEAAAVAVGLGDAAADAASVAVGEAFGSSASEIFALPGPKATIIPSTAIMRIFLRQFSMGCIVS